MSISKKANHLNGLDLDRVRVSNLGFGCAGYGAVFRHHCVLKWNKFIFIFRQPQPVINKQNLVKRLGKKKFAQTIQIYLESKLGPIRIMDNPQIIYFQQHKNFRSDFI